MAPSFRNLRDPGDDPVQPLVSQTDRLQGRFGCLHEVTSFSESTTGPRTQMSVSSGLEWQQATVGLQGVKEGLGDEKSTE